MEPTPFARQLAEPVRQALALLESALAHGPGFDPASSTRTFRFYMSDIGEIFFLPPLVERVGKLAPGVRLEVASMDPEEIAAALANGALDVAVGFLPSLGAPVRRRRLFRDPYVCLMRADHALVSYRGGHRVIEEALERAGLGPRIALRVPHFTVVPMVLERTDMLLTLPARVAQVYERQGRFKSLPPPVPIPQAEVAVHWHERFEGDPGNRWLRDLVIELYSETPM
jgi:DNA-binding transcriptional LysR family regulator